MEATTSEATPGRLLSTGSLSLLCSVTINVSSVCCVYLYARWRQTMTDRRAALILALPALSKQKLRRSDIAGVIAAYVR
eukprot:2103959-Amphidinium_carterae.1